MQRFAILVFCCVSHLGLFPLYALGVERDEKEEILARIKRELPEAHRRLRERFANVKVTGEYSKKVYTAGVTYYVKDDMLQCELRYDKKHRIPSYPDGRVYSIHDGAAFRLEYASPSTYVIEQYNTDKDWVQRVRFITNVVIERFLFAPFQMDSLRASDVVQAPSFKLISASKTQWKGREAIRVHAKWKLPPQWERSQLESGNMTFVPSLDWAMTEWKLREKALYEGKPVGTEEFSAKLDYGPLNDGEAIYPRTVEYTVKSIALGKPNEYNERESLRIDSVEPGVVTDEQFSPAAYGLPDYLHPRRAWYRRPLFWIIAVNIALLALVVWYLLRRRARA